MKPPNHEKEPVWRARFIWLDEGRTLPNTFAVFRKTVSLSDTLCRAYVSADSRYQLFVNGQYVCRGPAPYDPRYQCYDSIDLTEFLQPGRNAFAAIVVHYGQGDGTYIAGVPGFLLQVEDDKENTVLVTDDTWKAKRCRAWSRDVPRRSFLRSLQEDFDAFRSPASWLTSGYDDSEWESARVLNILPGHPSISLLHPDRLMPGFWPPKPEWRLESRGIPLMEERPESPVRVLRTGNLRWRVSPEEYFAHGIGSAFEVCIREETLMGRNADVLPIRLRPQPGESDFAILDFGKQMVGFPSLRVVAEPGAIIELVWDERETEIIEPDSFIGNWSRYRCVPGEQEWTAWDYETFRYLQIMARGAPVEIRDFRCISRRYPFENRGSFECSDPLLNEVWEVARHTLTHVAQDTMVDNNWRERQQYSGEGDSAKLGIYYAFGDPRLPRRMIRQYAQGQLESGQLCACWPSWDKLFRRMQGAMGVDCWTLEIVGHSLFWVVGLERHVLFTGEKDLARELLPNVRRLLDWCFLHRDAWGLLTPEGWQDATFWIDHGGFDRSTDWILPTNLYFLWCLESGGKLEALTGHDAEARKRIGEAEELKNVLRKRFWNSNRRLLLDDRVGFPGEANVHEINQSLAILLGVVPEPEVSGLLDLLDRNPMPFRTGTPPTAVYRYWALSKGGRVQTILDDLRTRWAGMPSFRENRTFGETWEGHWCRCQFSVGPLFILMGEILGVRPLTPGFEQFDIQPKLGNLEWVRGTVPVPGGEIRVEAERIHDEVRWNWKRT